MKTIDDLEGYLDRSQTNLTCRKYHYDGYKWGPEWTATFTDRHDPTVSGSAFGESLRLALVNAFEKYKSKLKETESSYSPGNPRKNAP